MILNAFVDFTRSPLFKYLITSIFIVVLVLVIFLLHKKEGQVHSRKYVIKRLAIVASFSAISIILYIFGIDIKIFIPYMPSFLEVHFSLIPIYVIVALYGPGYASIAIIIRTLGKLLFVSSSSFGVGELADIIIGLSVVLVFYVIFVNTSKKNKLLYALIASALVWIFVGVFINWTIIIPFYVHLMLDGNVNALVGMMSTIPGINASNYMGIYLLVACLPFNAIAASINSFLSFFVIKGLSKVFIDNK